MGEPNLSYEKSKSKITEEDRKVSRLSKIKRNWNKYAIVYIFLVPILIHFSIFHLFPILFSLYITFTDWPIIGDPEFVGFKNWINFFSDEMAWKAIWNTILFSLYYIVPTMALGLFLAILINSGKRGTGLFKGIFFLPVVTSFVVISGIWAWLFKGTDDGFLNAFIGMFGIPPQLFLSNSSQALIVLAGLSIFKVCGSTMIYYYAGLQSIPEEYYEAARIDGAANWKLFWKITFPLLLPIHFYVGIITTIGSFQIFDSAYLLTSGGPNYSTTTIVYYLYQEGFTSLRLGYASVLAYVLFFIVFGISLIQKKYFGKEVSYK
ncbi:carbohydrate ABC transporter permease [Metabacillus arenae]|uniref:Sugar ABC transporter permease n=1 Tax=Metabacillus arenae TaxID=2771434 RepID=A0A926NFA0_9BACI|nr:sugar ABC transporter permease [Metabacillus arenae]MBD1380484.1 sugar ABC transporter permease [Metabacillus arenae]